MKIEKCWKRKLRIYKSIRSGYKWLSKSLEKATRSSRKFFKFSAKLSNSSASSKTCYSILKGFVICKKKFRSFPLVLILAKLSLKLQKKNNISKVTFQRAIHCVKSIQIRSFFWSVFSRIQSKYGKIRTRIIFVFAQFSRSDANLHKTSIMLLLKPNSYHTDNRLNDINFDKEIILKIIQ